MSTIDKWLWNIKQLNGQYQGLDSFQKIEIWTKAVEKILEESIEERTKLVHEALSTAVSTFALPAASTLNSLARLDKRSNRRLT